MKNSEHVPGAFAPAKRSLGQNFLCDQNIARKIVDALNIAPGDNVLEIGPGRGALTEQVVQRNPGRYVVLEMDDALAGALELKHPQIEVVRGDALTYDWAGLAEADKWKIVGNLPYNIASPLIWDIVSLAHFERAVFMVQLEAGQRLVAHSGGRDYGALSVFVQSNARAEMLFKVPPQVFRPQPKVTSAVLRFFSLADRPSAQEAQRLSSTLRLCFQMRRKQLGTILKFNNFSDYEAMLRKLDIDPMQRPETLEPERFRALSKVLPLDFLA